MMQMPNPSPMGKGKSDADSSSAGQNIQVYVRVRPVNNDEKQARSSIVITTPQANHKEVQVKEKSALPGQSKTFSFDRAFSEASTQADVYSSVAKPLVKQMLQGYNCTIFAYGQTGTGKTHTMEGIKDFQTNSWENGAEAGIIPRSLIDIFNEKLKNDNDKISHQIKVSFLELYNEEIFDLLSKGPDPERITRFFEDKKKGVVVVCDMQEIIVQSKHEVLRILAEASQKRQTAATKMNASSSRSHTIFTITVTTSDKTNIGQEKYLEGKLNLVDLAGSENIGRSGAVEQRAREAGNINKSLLTLGKVIYKLVNKESHIPYRESKLTFLLKDSLGGRTKTSIIATVSPASINLEETLSTLDYAHRAKNIKNRPEVNQKVPATAKMLEMHTENLLLKKQLEEQFHRNGGVFMSQESKDELDQKIMEFQHLQKEHTDLENLFGIKSTEADRLNGELAETTLFVGQLQDILAKTEEEREEHKFLAVKATEDKMKLQEQAFVLREVADQQYSDLGKVHDTLERKRSSERHNVEVSSRYQAESSSRFSTQRRVLSERAEVTETAMSSLKEKLNVPVDLVQQNAQDLLTSVTARSEETKQALASLSALASSRVETSKQFLSREVELAAALEECASKQTQAHLEKARKWTEQDKSAAQSTAMDVESITLKLKEHISIDDERCSARALKQRELFTTTNEKQDELHAKTERNIAKIRATIEEHNVSYEKREKRNMERIEALKKQLKELELDMEEDRMAHNALVESLLKVAEEATKLTGDAVASTKAAHKTELADMTAFVEDHSVRNAQALSDVEAFATSTLERQQTILREAEARLKDESKHAGKQSEEFGKRKIELETRCTERAEEETAWMEKMQEPINTELSSSAETLTQTEQTLAKHQTDLISWRSTTCSDLEAACQQLRDLDDQATVSVGEMEGAQSRFFAQEQRIDVPSGQTPSRTERPYPKKIVEGTPDDIRLKKFRQARESSAGKGGNVLRVINM